MKEPTIESSSRALIFYQDPDKGAPIHEVSVLGSFAITILLLSVSIRRSL